jgi:hypothetical protein
MNRTETVRRAATLVVALMAVVWGQSLAAQEAPAAVDALADAASDEGGGIGLSAGLELGAGNVLERGVFSIMPNVVFERSFEGLDVFGELDYTAAFDEPQTAHELALEVELGYSLTLSQAGALAFTVNNQDTFFLSPALEEGLTNTGVVEPAAQYTHALASIGDIWGKVGLPITYLTGIEGESALGLNVTAGWASTFGLGLELTGSFDLAPEAGFGMGLLATYESGRYYCEVEVTAANGFKDWEVLPELDVTFGAVVLTARLQLTKADGADWELKPFIGAGYQF